MHRIGHLLQKGSHPTRADGMCAMEMVAWLGGEGHTDEPACACPVIAALVRACNDALPDDQARSGLLLPLVPRIVNSRAGPALERARGFLCADAVARALVPMALLRRGRLEGAELLQGLAVVRDTATAAAALTAIEQHAPEQRAARWLLQRAQDGQPPARFAAAAVQVARGVGDATAFTLLAELVSAMLAVTVRTGSVCE